MSHHDVNLQVVDLDMSEPYFAHRKITLTSHLNASHQLYEVEPHTSTTQETKEAKRHELKRHERNRHERCRTNP